MTIVGQLRYQAGCMDSEMQGFMVDLLHNSADRIEELKAENTRLQGQIEATSDLLFGTDEPLTNPVNLDGLNGLFRNLRKTLGV